MTQVYVESGWSTCYIDRFKPEFGITLNSLYIWLFHANRVSYPGNNHKMAIL